MDGSRMNNYRYHIPDNGGSPEDDYYDFLSCFNSDDAELLAQDAAEDYHSNHDGWESSWPIVFVLMDSEGTLIGQYSVERETEPVFFARKVKE